MTSTTTDQTAAARMIDAFQAGVPDPDLCLPDATAWHNFDEVDLAIADSFAMITAILGVVPDFRFDDRRHYQAGADVSVAQYTLTGTLPDGSPLRIPACLIVFETQGKVRRIEEYLDMAQLAPLAALLGG